MNEISGSIRVTQEKGKPPHPVLVLDDGTVVTIRGVSDATLMMSANSVTRLSMDFVVESVNIIAFGGSSTMK